MEPKRLVCWGTAVLGNKHVYEAVSHGAKKADSGIILLVVNPGADLGQVPY